jgi:hypothetical protein
MLQRITLMSPDEELLQMLEMVTERILDNVDKYGFSIPICLAHAAAGERIYIVAEDSDPEAEYDVEKHIESILCQVQRMIAQGQLQSIAFAELVTGTVSGDNGPEESLAVKVLLDHQDGGGQTAYILYHTEEGKAVPDEVIYQPLEEPFFSR